MELYESSRMLVRAQRERGLEHCWWRGKMGGRQYNKQSHTLNTEVS